jgi:hypothetical protein
MKERTLTCVPSVGASEPLSKELEKKARDITDPKALWKYANSGSSATQWE